MTTLSKEVIKFRFTLSPPQEQKQEISWEL